MLELLADNKKLNIREGSIRLSIESPLFIDGFKSDISYPFTIDLKSNNSNLGYMHSKQIHSVDIKDKDAKVLFLKKLIASGQIKCTNSNDQAVKANLKIGSNNFFNTIKDKSLKDLSYTSHTFTEIKKRMYIEDCIINEYGTSNVRSGSTNDGPPYEFVCFPVYNDVMFQNTNWDTDWQGYKIWNYMPLLYDSSSYYGWSQNYIVYFPYVAAIVEKIFSYAGYRLFENPFNKGELRRLVLMAMHHRRDVETTTIFSMKDHVADFNIIDFLYQLKLIFGIEYFFDENNRSVRIKYWNEILTGSIVSNEKNFCAGSRSREFEESIDGYLFSYNFQEGELTSYLGTDIPNVSKDGGEYENIPSITAAATNFSESAPPEELHEDYKPHNDAPGGGSVIGAPMPAFIPVWQQPLYDDDVNITVPGGEFNYLSNYINLSKLNTINPKLCFWRGMQDIIGGNQALGYPQGSNSVRTFDYETGSIVKISDANLSLKWQDFVSGIDYGLIKNFFDEFLFFKQGQKIPEQFNLKLNTDQLIEIIRNIHKVRRVDGNNYLIKKIDASIKSKEIASVNIEAYRL